MNAASRGLPGAITGFHGLASFSLKDLIVWCDELKVDHPPIDTQHQAIFDLALEVAEIWHTHGDLAQLRAVTEKLGKVLESHFRFEEQQLADIGYTKLAEHRGEHKVMLDELQVIRGRLERMGNGTMRSEPGFLVLSYVLGVTVGHISHSDMDYRRFALNAAGQDGRVWPATAAVASQPGVSQG